jgi:hypothetical protein
LYWRDVYPSCPMARQTVDIGMAMIDQLKLANKTGIINWRVKRRELSEVAFSTAIRMFVALGILNQDLSYNHDDFKDCNHYKHSQILQLPFWYG